MNDGGTLEFVGLAVEAGQPSGACVGIVDDAPEAAAFLLGKRVLVPAADPCGQCEVCRRGGAAVCAHATRRTGIAKRLRVSTRWLVTLDDGLTLPLPAAAAVAGDVATAYTLYARTGLGPRDPAVVTGASAITRFVVEILRAKGVTPALLAPPGELARWALGKGAAVIDPGGADPRAQVTAAVVALGLGARPWRVIATDAASAALAADLAGPRATLTVLADGDVPALPGALLAREVTVVGVAGAHPDLIVEAAAMCAKGEIDLAAGVTTAEGDPTRARVQLATM